MHFVNSLIGKNVCVSECIRPFLHLPAKNALHALWLVQRVVSADDFSHRRHHRSELFRGLVPHPTSHGQCDQRDQLFRCARAHRAGWDPLVVKQTGSVQQPTVLENRFKLPRSHFFPCNNFVPPQYIFFAAPPILCLVGWPYMSVPYLSVRRCVRDFRSMADVNRTRWQSSN